jgi:hypothetical protein
LSLSVTVFLTSFRPSCEPSFACLRSRDFDDENVLIQHQMAKHFKCPECPRKLENVASMISHMQGVHKQKLTKCVFPSPLLRR